jgi:branched-chain amino acid transport system permease protein
VFYREVGQFKTSYDADEAIFPIAQDRWSVIVLIAFASLGVPLFAGQYLYTEVLIPVLILSIAAIGLNILTGYCGQLSLGSGGFMAVGAYAAYNLALRLPETNIILVFLFAGVMAMLVGLLFGLPSLRIKGFYLAVATLASQFFLEWAFARVKWFTNYAPSGSVAVGRIELFGIPIDTPGKTYIFVLAITVVLTLAAKNLVRGRIGRMWMAIRDMDIAAEIIGIRPLHAKLSAFAVSSFYIGVGTLLGSFLGAAFIVLVPIFLNQLPSWLGIAMSTAMISHIEFMLFGAMIVLFLIAEPHGLARLWAIGKEKLRLWPFPY